MAPLIPSFELHRNSRELERPCRRSGGFESSCASSEPTVELAPGKSSPQIPGISIEDALYLSWGLDVLLNARQLAGECRCSYNSRAAEDLLGVVGYSTAK